MAASAVISSASDVRAFIAEYFTAWQGTDIDRIMRYYADDISLVLFGTPLEGPMEVEYQFVRPIVSAFPGNRHVIKNLIYGQDTVVVEWSFEAEHMGEFAGIPATGVSVKLPGCSVYEYDPAGRQITCGRIYGDFGKLIQQIGGA